MKPHVIINVLIAVIVNYSETKKKCCVLFPIWNSASLIYIMNSSDLLSNKIGKYFGLFWNQPDRSQVTLSYY